MLAAIGVIRRLARIIGAVDMQTLERRRADQLLDIPPADG